MPSLRSKALTIYSTSNSISALPALSGIYSSEAVSRGHPDKICDQISDAILDAALEQDPDARVAVECGIKDHSVWLFGELTTNGQLDYEGIVKRVLQEIGHSNEQWGLDVSKLDLRLSIDRQSAEIGSGVGASNSEQLGAGDQGIMFGYATSEAASGLPLPFDYARRLINQHRRLQSAGSGLGPDAKAQVSAEYIDGKPARITAIVLSSQHSPDLSLETVRELLREEVVQPVFGEIAKDAELYLNPAGTFVVGGTIADAGLPDERSLQTHMAALLTMVVVPFPERTVPKLIDLQLTQHAS